MLPPPVKNCPFVVAASKRIPKRALRRGSSAAFLEMPCPLDILGHSLSIRRGKLSLFATVQALLIQKNGKIQKFQPGREPINPVKPRVLLRFAQCLNASTAIQFTTSFVCKQIRMKAS